MPTAETMQYVRYVAFREVSVFAKSAPGGSDRRRSGAYGEFGGEVRRDKVEIQRLGALALVRRTWAVVGLQYIADADCY